MQKTFKTLEEQVSIMQGKGLIITNTKEAEDILLRENYFFFNGYRMLFMESASNKKFIEGTTFEEVYAMFQFDRHMRNIIFKNLLIIENNIKLNLSNPFIFISPLLLHFLVLLFLLVYSHLVHVH